jgi:hypothetical protein
MLEPIAKIFEEEAQIMHDRILELFESDSDDEMEDVVIPPELSHFLTIGAKGPWLDEQTVWFLFSKGVTGGWSFLLYSQQSFQEMISPLSTVDLPMISQNNALCDVKLYGDYVFQHSIVDTKAINIDIKSIDINSYQLYLQSHQRRAKESLQEAVALKMDVCIKAQQARKARQLSHWQSSGVSPKFNHPTPHTNPDPGAGDGIKPDVAPPIISPPDTPDTPQATLCSKNSPLTEGHKADPQQGSVKADFSATGFLRRLSDHDDYMGDFLDMVIPTDDELPTPQWLEDKNLLTPCFNFLCSLVLVTVYTYFDHCALCWRNEVIFDWVWKL